MSLLDTCDFCELGGVKHDRAELQLGQGPQFSLLFPDLNEPHAIAWMRDATADYSAALMPEAFQSLVGLYALVAMQQLYAKTCMALED
jgi:hypothetical protein